jgi:hypothetical protein
MKTENKQVAKRNVKTVIPPQSKLGVFMLRMYVKFVLIVLLASINLKSSFCNFITHPNNNMASDNGNNV